MNRKNIRRLVLLLSVVCLAAVVIYNNGRMAENQQAMQRTLPAQAPQVPTVAVVEVIVASYQARVEGVGSAEARYELQVNSRISGQVVAVDGDFESGRLVKRGTELVTLDDSQWQSELAAARHTEANAKVSYLQEQQEVKQAQQEWSTSGLTGEPLSPLVLRKPQLAAAKAALDSASQSVTAAEENLTSTRIKAPFDAIVVSRNISPGSYVQAGSEIGQLLSADAVNVRIPLPASDWSVLPEEAELLSGNYPVELTQVDTDQRWMGTVVRAEKSLNSDTRQRALVVSVTNPLTQNSPLYPGTFLKVVIPGRRVANLWRLPASALSQRGEIWIVNDSNRLAAYPADIRFSDRQHLYVTPPAGYRNARVLVQPLNSYSEGMQVQPQREPSHD